MGMARIRVEPLGITLAVEDGETIFDAAWRQGYSWPTICQGAVQCAQCQVTVRAGLENFVPPGEEEQALLRWIAIVSSGAAVRLACRALVTGDAVVHRTGVRPLGAESTENPGANEGG
jgi:2Fe-2S ferredoxin